MIDRETAIQWATDAGFVGSSTFILSEWGDEFQALITRAQNEAYKKAATTIQLIDDETMKGEYMLDASECAGIIEALIQEMTK